MASFHVRVRRGEQSVLERKLQNVFTLNLDASDHFRWIAEKDPFAELQTEAD